MKKLDDRFIEFDTSDPYAVTGENISASSVIIDKLDDPPTTRYQQSGAPTPMNQNDSITVTHASLSGKEGQVFFQVMENVGGNYQVRRLVTDYVVRRVSDTTTRFTKISAGSTTGVYATVTI